MPRILKLLFSLLLVAVLAFVGYRRVMFLVDSVNLVMEDGEIPVDYSEQNLLPTEEPPQSVTFPPELTEDSAYDGNEVFQEKLNDMNGEETYSVDKTIEELIEEAKRNAELP